MEIHAYAVVSIELVEFDSSFCDTKKTSVLYVRNTKLEITFNI